MKIYQVSQDKSNFLFWNKEDAEIFSNSLGIAAGGKVSEAQVLGNPNYGVWISVGDSLPEIPEGNFGVAVIIAEFDDVLKDSCGGNGYNVTLASYGNTKGHKMFDGCALRQDFMSIYIGGEEECQFGPTGDIVTHWMYMPSDPSK